MRSRKGSPGRPRLYAIIFMVTERPASLIVLKHEDATATSGDGRKAW